MTAVQVEPAETASSIGVGDRRRSQAPHGRQASTAKVAKWLGDCLDCVRPRIKSRFFPVGLASFRVESYQ